jgi:hypothetical protein
MGLAPASCLEGDIVCIFLGCSVSMILSERNEGFVLVGEAYMQGLMEGEFAQIWEEGKLVLEQFVIQ